MLRRRRPQLEPGVAAWAGHGTTIMLGTRRLASPMVYVGQGVRAVHDTGGRLEPAAIDPSLPISSQRDVSEPDQLDYHALSPEQRTTYLDLLGDLAAGIPRDAPSWSARLHLWGLERRVLVDFAVREHEPTARYLLERLRRLDPLLDEQDRSAARTLAVLASSRLPLDDSARPVHVSSDHIEVLPSAADITVGWYELGGRPIPIDVQLALLDLCVSSPVPRARRECPVEFVALYEILEKDEPLTARALATIVREIVVEPVSPSFKLPISVPTTVLAPGERGALLSAIAELADVAAEDLEPYRRWCSSRPGGDVQLAQRLLLPPDLGGREVGATPMVIELAREVIDRPGELISIADLTAPWPLGTVDSIDEYVDLLRVLERAGIGVVPDPRFEDPVDLGGTCLVFSSDPMAGPDPEMLWDLDMLRAAWRVIESDGQPNAAELWRLEDRLTAASGRHPGRDARLLATYRWLRDVDTGWLAMPDLARSHHENEMLARFLVALACTDGHYATAEHDALVETFEKMGFDEAAVDRLLDELTGHRVSHAPLPPPVPRQAAPSDVLDDPAAVEPVVEADLPDTEHVDAPVESPVLIDDEPNEPSAVTTEVPPTGEAEQAEALGDTVPEVVERREEPRSGIVAILWQLAEEDELTIARARAIAQEHGFFWGALTEEANELALDLTGRIVCDEDGDDVEIARDVLEQMG